MRKTVHEKSCRTRFGTSSRTAAMVMAALLILAVSMWTTPLQAAPLAGTSIGNQASATYTDASAVSRTATSNTVQTIVQQVASLALVNTQSKIVAAGGTVYFPHTLTNTGNGSDTFNLTAIDANSGTINFATIAIYPDANGDGVPDSFAAITTTGALAAGSSFNFIVATTVSGASTDGQADTITVTATSTYGSLPTASNTDTVNVSGNAIVVMTKSVTPGSGTSASGAVTYTLTYTNTGNATATNLIIIDNVPSGMTYNTGDKARWSVTGAVALTDAAGGAAQSSGAYTIDYSSVAQVVSATINQVLPGESRTLTFEVAVDAGAAPGVINNTATFGYNDGAGSKNGASNPTPFTVNQLAAVVANNTAASSANGVPENTITVAAAVQGSTVTFPAYVWNSGNGSDSFDITISGGTFPAGTSFILYKSDGVTPLVDTNSNSTPDTGTLAAGAKYNVVVKAILPASATGSSLSATLTATSKLDNSKSDPVTMTLTEITANSVDLTLTDSLTTSTPAGAADGGNAPSTGFGAGPEALALTPHKAANPGTTTTFVLKLNNTSATSDNYDLAASTDSTFAVVSLPAGWTVILKADGGAGNCSTTGAVISNSGVVNALNNSTVCAIISVPSNAPAGAQDIYFRALSPTSSASDRLHSAVDVNTIRAISVTNSQTGQVFPGGTVVYPMTATNNGNVTEGTVAAAGTPDGSSNSKIVIGITDSLAAQGWNSVVYFDANGNGTIDPADPVVSDLSFVSNGFAGLAPGESIPLLVKVFAPAGAGIGNIDTTTLTATTSGVINGAAAALSSSATDTSTVISGQVSLTKLQALDAACDGTADAAFAQSNITTGAVPGACILYQITAKNVGTASINTLVVSDATPANTVYNAGTDCPVVGGTFVAASTGGGVVTSPAQCSTGSISVAIATLNPGSTAVITFGVQINR